MKTNGHKTTKTPALALRAERALRHANCRNQEPCPSVDRNRLAELQSSGKTSMRDVRKYATEQAISEEEALAKEQGIYRERRGSLQQGAFSDNLR